MPCKEGIKYAAICKATIPNKHPKRGPPRESIERDRATKERAVNPVKMPAVPMRAAGIAPGDIIAVCATKGASVKPSRPANP